MFPLALEHVQHGAPCIFEPGISLSSKEGHRWPLGPLHPNHRKYLLGEAFDLQPAGRSPAPILAVDALRYDPFQSEVIGHCKEPSSAACQAGTILDRRRREEGRGGEEGVRKV